MGGTAPGWDGQGVGGPCCSPNASDTNHFRAFPRDAQTSQKFTDPNPTCKQKRAGAEPPAAPVPSRRPGLSPPPGPPAPPHTAAAAGTAPRAPPGRGEPRWTGVPGLAPGPQLGDRSPALPNAARPASGGSENPGRGSLWNVVIDLRTCRTDGRTGVRGTGVRARARPPAQHPLGTVGVLCPLPVTP